MADRGQGRLFPWHETVHQKWDASQFFLGTHQVNWLWSAKHPIFLSYQRLRDRIAGLKPATCDWALDSGGFTELNKSGRWTIQAERYAADAQRYSDTAGRLRFCAIQDWMCEPYVLEKTGKSIREHQELTCVSYMQLRELAPDLPWIPILQGWSEGDYIEHADLWETYGVDLRGCDIVGIGSVCRRQGTKEAEIIVQRLHGLGIKLHLFGFKSAGLLRCHRYAATADSMAWSFIARKRKIRLEGCSHATCANCPVFAEQWRDVLLCQLNRTCFA